MGTYIRLGLQQQLDASHMARLARLAKRREAISACGVDHCPMLEQCLHAAVVALVGGRQEGRAAIA